MAEVREIHALLDGGENVLMGDIVAVGIEGFEALDQLADAARAVSACTGACSQSSGVRAIRAAQAGPPALRSRISARLVRWAATKPA